jgi:hypothetical protein
MRTVNAFEARSRVSREKSKSWQVRMQVLIPFSHCDAICLLPSRSPYELPWNTARTYCAGYRRAGASQEARMFRVSSVPRPGRDVFADLIRPSEPPWGIR